MERFSISDASINISDILDVIEMTDPSFAEQNRAATHDVEMISGSGCLEPTRKPPPQPLQQQQQQPQPQPQQQPQPQPQQSTAATGSTASGNGRQMPRVEIVEQPASKSLRFRYECEGRSAGSIPGVNSTPENKTFPTIRIVGYKGRAMVVVSCVTKDPPYRPHPHNLVGKEVCKDGVCTVRISSESMTVSFDKLGIQCVKRKDIEEALKVRQKNKVDPFGTGFDHKRQSTSIDLNAVRLCFHVFLEGQGKGKFIPLLPIVSEPIYDKKAMSDLVICKLSHCSASVAGGTDMILLCEKVAKEDIQVRFFEERDGQLQWEGFGNFQSSHVHKQVAIAFQTPKYRMQQIDRPIYVFVQLRRPSDGTVSDPVDFMFLPLEQGRLSHLWSLGKALARNKAYYHSPSKFYRVYDQAPHRSHLHDQLNNSANAHSTNGFDTIEDIINAKRAYSKLSALRALHDIYNVQRNNNSYKVCNAQVRITSTSTSLPDIENNDANDDGARTILPEENGSVYESQKTVNENTKSDCFEYNQVSKWVEKTQSDAKDHDLEVNRNDMIVDNVASNGEKPLNELLNELVELDNIYEDTHIKLMQERQKQQQISSQTKINDNKEELDVPDNQTYTSLQMAMKNPVWVRTRRRYLENTTGATIVSSPIIAVSSDVPPPRPPPLASRIKRDVPQKSDEPLPPLPPKRIRKTPSMPVLPRAVSNQMLTDQQRFDADAAPVKNLPTPPSGNSTLPKQSKPGLFSKLFSKKTKREDKVGSSTSLPGLSKQNSDHQHPPELKPEILPSVKTMTASNRSLEVEGDQTPPYGTDLTEAEHYALYTAMAPHATASEFDEMSCYYSPVEGGKILTEVKENDECNSLRRKRQKFNNSPRAQVLRHLQAEAEKISKFQIQHGPSEPSLLNQLPQYNFSLIKPEPRDVLPPFGGSSMSTAPSSPIFQVGNVNAPNISGLRAINSPRRTPSPMGCALYNIPPPPQVQHILASQLQPNIMPQDTIPPILMQDPLAINEPPERENNLTLGNTHIVSNAIENTVNIGGVLDNTTQSTGDFDLNFSQFDNVDLTSLNISDIVKEGVNREVTADSNSAEESGMTDSFTKLTRNTIQELCSLNSIYKPIRDDLDFKYN